MHSLEHATQGSEEFWVEICGRPVPAVDTADGVRAVVKNKAVEPDSVERYLASKFGEELKAVRNAMNTLAKAFTPEQLATEAFHLYEQFRPAIPEGVTGWGAKGELNLAKIRALAATR